VPQLDDAQVEEPATGHHHDRRLPHLPSARVSRMPRCQPGVTRHLPRP
jgi:hypothetical protein